MTVTIELQPDIERGLLARAAAQGVSITDYLQDIVAREVGKTVATNSIDAGAAPAAQPANLMDLFEPMRGLLTDEEVDTLFARNPSTGRSVDLG
jgi:hypothetical protein